MSKDASRLRRRHASIKQYLTGSLSRNWKSDFRLDSTPHRMLHPDVPCVAKTECDINKVIYESVVRNRLDRRTGLLMTNELYRNSREDYHEG